MNALSELLNVPKPVKLRVADFVLLCDSGAFDEYAKSELIEGEILCLNSQWSRHARAKTNLLVELSLVLRSLTNGLAAISEVSVHLTDDSMPEPDIVLTSYKGIKAVPLATVALIVEVADATLANDLGRKAALYARAGVTEYWVVDVEGNVIHQMWHPGETGYAGKRELSFGNNIAAKTVPGICVSTRCLL